MARCTIRCTDSEKDQFGVCLHMDHIIMEYGSAAARIAKLALIATDEKTDFKCAYPCHKKDASSILDCVHRIEGAEPSIRPWWKARYCSLVIGQLM